MTGRWVAVVIVAAVAAGCSYEAAPPELTDQPIPTTSAGPSAARVVPDDEPEPVSPLEIQWYDQDGRLPLPVPTSAPPDRRAISRLTINGLTVSPAPATADPMLDQPVPPDVIHVPLDLIDDRTGARFRVDVFAGSAGRIDEVEAQLAPATIQGIVVARRTDQILTAARVTATATAEDNRPFLDAVVAQLTAAASCAACGQEPEPATEVLWAGVGPSPEGTEGLRLRRVPDASFGSAGMTGSWVWWLDGDAITQNRSGEWVVAATGVEAADADQGVHAWVSAQTLHVANGWTTDSSAARQWVVPVDRVVTDLAVTAGTVGDGDVIALRSEGADGHRWDVFAVDRAIATGEAALVRVGTDRTEQIRWTRGGWWGVEDGHRLVHLGSDGAPASTIVTSAWPITSWDLDRSGRRLIVAVEGPLGPESWLVTDGTELVDLSLAARFVRWVD